MNHGELGQLVDEALAANEGLIEYANYPPIFNSRMMLLEISKHQNNKDYLFMNQSRLNDGLLAAKALDFEREYDRDLYVYAAVLHDTWAAVLTLIGKQFRKPKLNPKKIAYDFYDKHNYDHNRIGSHLLGINFNFPIQISTLNKLFIVGQWKIPSISQGDYYAEINNVVNPDCLGINDLQEDKNTGTISRRIEHRYECQKDIVVLQSVAAPVLDTWSIKSPPHPKKTSGGCTQYFNASDKKSLKQIYP